MARGERPIKLGNSWFSAKTIEVVRSAIAPWGRALDGLGGSDSYQTQLNSEYKTAQLGRQTVGAKFHRREGNSPDHLLRSLNDSSVGKEVGCPRQPGGWLRSSHPLKKA